MVGKLLRRLAGRRASTSGVGETLARRNSSAGRLERSGPVGYPLPSAWVKMHVWRRDHGQCVLCGGHERVWFNYLVPPWEGGSISEQNIRLMCERCSRRNKGVRMRRKKPGA
jgi:5-methylcytosine-specific restriction endonuclease McrA